MDADLQDPPDVVLEMIRRQFAVGYNASMDNPVKSTVGDKPDIVIEVKAHWLLAKLARHAARAHMR